MRWASAGITRPRLCHLVSLSLSLSIVPFASSHPPPSQRRLPPPLSTVAHPSSSKFLIWPPKRVGNSEASKRSMLEIPLSPASSLAVVRACARCRTWRFGGRRAAGSARDLFMQGYGCRPALTAEMLAPATEDRMAAATATSPCQSGSREWRTLLASSRAAARAAALIGDCAAHVWSAACSVDDPFGLSAAQWLLKHSSYAHTPVVELIGVVAEHGAAANAGDHDPLLGVPLRCRGGPNGHATCNQTAYACRAGASA